MKKRANSIYKVTTSSGYKITATDDHPLFTKSGMIDLKYLKIGDQIAVYPFKGVKYEKSTTKTIINERDVKLLKLTKTSELQIIKTLKSKNLFPLKTNNPKLPYLLKLFGFIIGDGTIYFTKTKGTISFYGKEKDLESIREDIKKLGFNPSRVYTRNRNHKIKTQYNTYDFDRVEHSFKTTSTSLARLFELLEIPVGNKSNQKYEVPQWILNLKKWQKRLFLAALFGAELSSPSTITGHNYNFYCPVLSVNKSDENIQSGIKFLKQIKLLLKEFGIRSNIIRLRQDEVNDKISTRIRLSIYQTSDNLIKLWSVIGYEYNKEKTILANLAAFWLENKKRFLKDNKLSNVRVGQQKKLFFEDFKSFIKHNRIESGIIWDTIKSKREIPYNNYVYDFTVDSEHHNFIANNFIVSNCGVRMLTTNLSVNEFLKKRDLLINEVYKNVPSGLGSKGTLRVTKDVLMEVLKHGSKWAIKEGYGIKDDIDRTEEYGCMPKADSSAVSDTALKRGMPQLGSLGSGNHFLEVDKVDKIFDEKIAKEWGINPDNVVIQIHCGSRGLGHQVASDYIKLMEQKYGFSNLLDRELINAPINSDLGQKYYGAMSAAVNFAFANRQMIMHWVRESFEKVYGKIKIGLIFDQSHNNAKFEKHLIDGKWKEVCLHRKGASRSFGPGREELPLIYQGTGQPVIIPGSIGTASYLLVGTKKAEEVSFASTAHGAGRLMSRHEALRQFRGEKIKQELHEKNIEVRSGSWEGLAEEGPLAYKDIESVIEVSHNVGIGSRVVRVVPLACIKG